MEFDKPFKLSLDFGGQHYEGEITPSAQKGARGMPVSFRVTIGDELFAYLCCGDQGWTDRGAAFDGNGKPRGLIDAIGRYIFSYYE